MVMSNIYPVYASLNSITVDCCDPYLLFQCHIFCVGASIIMITLCVHALIVLRYFFYICFHLF